MKKVVGTVIVMTLLVTGSGLYVMYSGVFNVASQWEDPAPVGWVLATTRESSISERAKSITVPPARGQEQINQGFRGYRDMCAVCHTPPGADKSPLAQGLNPAPPDLAESARKMSDAELFWVTKYGIRMTGMPAWGATHSDGELWDVVAFVKMLPALSQAEYQAMDRGLEKGHDHSGHTH